MGIDDTFNAGKAQTRQAFVFGVQLCAGSEETGDVLLFNAGPRVFHITDKRFPFDPISNFHCTALRRVTNGIFHQVPQDAVFNQLLVVRFPNQSEGG